VSFYVDPEILDDPEARGTPAITLSYTFHVTDMPEDYAALDADDDTAAEPVAN
jgi:cytochrome c oxidase assembly protein subunit 11